MNKTELIELLKNYKENIAKLKLRKREKDKCERRINIYIHKESSITSAFGINNDIHSKNMISNKVEKTAIDSVIMNEEEIAASKDKIKRLEAEIKELEDKIAETKIRLSALKYREKEMLYAFYVEGRSYEDIGNNLYFKLFNQTREMAAIRKIIERATEKMLNL